MPDDTCKTDETHAKDDRCQSDPAGAGASIDSICLYFHRTAVVMVDGEVVSCANNFAENVGRLDDTTPFIDIWNGARMVDLRGCFGGPDEWRQCRTCWFREVRYHSQREAFANRLAFGLENASDYNEDSWDFRKYRAT